MKVGLGCGIVRLKEGKRKKKGTFVHAVGCARNACDVAEEMMWD